MEKRKINRFCEVAALVLALAALLTLIGTGLTERVHLGTWGGKTEAVAFLPISPVQGAALLLGGMLAALALFALLKRHARLGWTLAALWGAAAAMAALGRTIFEDSRISRACEAAGLLVWPALLFCQQVYGTIPMLFFVSLAMLCYAKYVKTRRRALGAAFACLLALAYAAKINAAVALIAVTICSVLDALENRKLEPLAYAALAIALSLLLLRAIIWQYERRSGVTLNSGIGALARLTMGMQEGGGAAGWFNRYTERFFPLEVTARQQHDIALADLKARLAEMAQNPAQTAAFFREKFCSQWMEPTMGMLWNGALSEHTGAFGETAARFFAKDHTALETLLGAFQRALYAFSAAGIIGMLRDRKRSGLCLLLPLIFFGGALYHLLFEAKSQYAFPYAVLLLPMAAMGICRIEDGLKGKRA